MSCSSSSKMMKKEGEEEDERQVGIRKIQARLSFCITVHDTLRLEKEIIEISGRAGTPRSFWVNEHLAMTRLEIIRLDAAQTMLLGKSGFHPAVSPEGENASKDTKVLKNPWIQNILDSIPPTTGPMKHYYGSPLFHAIITAEMKKFKERLLTGGKPLAAWDYQMKCEFKLMFQDYEDYETSDTEESKSAMGSPGKADERRSMGRTERKERLGSATTETEAVHPSLLLSQEEYLSALGLVTHEVARRRQMEPKKVGRSRRATANPKYSSNGFVEPCQSSSKRTRKHDQESIDKVIDIKKRKTSSKCENEPTPACQVCEQKGWNVTCKNCTGKYHDTCIRMTGSKAKIPRKLNTCPNCVLSTTSPAADQIMKPVSSSSTPSIMSSSSINKSRKMTFASIVENHVISASASILVDRSKTNYLNKIPVRSVSGDVKNCNSVVPLKKSHCKNTQKVTVAQVEVVPRVPPPTAHLITAQKNNVVDTDSPWRGPPSCVKWIKNPIKLRKVCQKTRKVKENVSVVVSSDSVEGVTRESGCQTSFTPPINSQYVPKKVINNNTNDGETVIAGHSASVNNSKESVRDNNNSKDILDFGGLSQKESKIGARGKISNGIKSAAANAVSVKKTILAMTAAAKSVMATGIKIPQPPTPLINQNKDKIILEDRCRPVPEFIDTVSAVIDCVARNVPYEPAQAPSYLPLACPQMSTKKSNQSCVNKQSQKPKTPVSQSQNSEKPKQIVPPAEYSESTPTESEPTTPASTLPLLSPVESRTSGDGLPRMTLSMSMSSELSSSSSSSSDDRRSEIEEESDVLLSLTNSPKSFFNDSEGVKDTNDKTPRATDMEGIFQLREAIIDLKNQLSDTRELKSKLLGEEQAVKENIRQLHQFIECFQRTFPEIKIPNEFFGLPASPSESLPASP